LHDESSSRLPVEIGPVSRAYVILSCAIGSPALLWLVGFSLGRKMPIQLLYIPSGMALLLLVYLKNKTLRLDETGVSQGFSVFRTFMRYEGIAEIRKEVRSFKGASTVVLVVSEKNSPRRIVIPIASFERTELSQLLGVLAQKAPQTHLKADVYL
jgi:hypothetical protein